jgi:hypothetical protein
MWIDCGGPVLKYHNRLSYAWSLVINECQIPICGIEEAVALWRVIKGQIGGMGTPAARKRTRRRP